MKSFLVVVFACFIAACGKDNPAFEPVETPLPPADPFLELVSGHGIYLIEDAEIALKNVAGNQHLHLIRGYVFHEDGTVEFYRQIVPSDWELGLQTIIERPQQPLNWSTGKWDAGEIDCDAGGANTICGTVDLWDGEGSLVGRDGSSLSPTSYDYWFMTWRLHEPSGFLNIGDSTQDWRWVTEARMDSLLTIPMDLN